MRNFGNGQSEEGYDREVIIIPVPWSFCMCLHAHVHILAVSPEYTARLSDIKASIVESDHSIDI